MKSEPATSFLLQKWSYSKQSLLALVFCCSLPCVLNAQVVQTNRYEYSINSSNDNYEIIPAGVRGLFLNRRVSHPKEDILEIVKLDTALVQQWAGFINVEKNYIIVGRININNKLYVLLRFKDYSRHDLILYIIDEDDGKYTRHQIKSYIPFSPTDFQVTSNAAIIGGYYNRVPIVLYFSFGSLKSKVLPGLINESGELNQIRIYPDATFDVLINARNFMRQQTIWIKSYDPEGNLLRNLALEPGDNIHLLFGRSVKIDEQTQVVAGVFGSRNREYSKGMFIASIDPSGVQQMKYYYFGELENFFKYMKAKREQRVKNRIERKKVKGKRARFNYRFLVHELIPHRDQYIMLGEAFYPRYRNIDRSYYGGFFAGPTGPNRIQGGRIFDGYFYTHAVVMGFDRKGQLLWDNSFEINDVTTFTLDQFVKLEVQDDKILLLYVFENELRTKIIQDDKVLEGKSNDPLLTFNSSDIVRNSSGSRTKLEYWYDDYLFAYGVQDILTPVIDTFQKKRVFFINKITFDN